MEAHDTNDSDASPSSLCSVCKSMFSSQLEEDSGSHHETLQSFERSRQSNCFICCYVWIKLGNTFFNAAKPSQITSTSFSIDRRIYMECFELDLEVHSDPTDDDGPWIVKFLLFPQNSVTDHHPSISDPDKLVINRKVEGSTNSTATFDIILEWLRACNPESHPYCHRDRSTSPLQLPTRLLDIKNPSLVKVVSTSDDITSSDYITLSHCWGTKKMVTLTKETSSQLFAGFDEQSLPRSFKDAVSITRKLGIDYIWIDSLCIFQDDLSDWSIESERMAEVYSGGYCNIAATAARDSSEGCFYSGDRWMAESCVVQATWTSVKRPDLIYSDDYLLCIGDFWESGITRQPLAQRAWVVQERFLAKRTIHFSKPQVFWECGENMASETFPKRVPIGMPGLDAMSLFWKNPQPLLPKKRIVDQLDKGPRPSLTTWMSVYLDGEVLDRWQAIIEAYSKCSLTMERDKLPAIAGVAKVLGCQEDRGRYLDGLWEKDFFKQALWWVWSNRENVRKPKQYRAPSFSWASVDAEIVHHSWSNPKLVSNLSLLTMKRALVTPDLIIPKDFPSFVRIEGPLHVASVTTLENAPTTHNTLQLGNSIEIVAHVYWDTGGGRHEGTLQIYILPMWYSTDGDEGEFCGLALTASGSSRGEFQRLGVVVSLRLKEGLDPVLNGFAEVPEECYESRRMVAMNNTVQILYTFTIV